MPSIFRTNPVEVTNRLDEIGWRKDQLLEVVAAMVAARNSCTANDPSSAPGWMAWKEGIRRLREIGCPMGLERDETDQIPSVIDRERGIKFTVSNTDDCTGLEIADRVPQNRSKKGPATDRVVSDNQGSFLDVLDATANVVPLSMARRQPGILVCWYVCAYSEGDEVRAELSCPTSCEGGFFSDFIERIVLIGPEGPDGAPVRRGTPEDGPEFDVPVVRKK